MIEKKKKTDVFHTHAIKYVFRLFRLAEFLCDCAERICLLRLIHRRVINRFQKFLLWLGYPRGIIQETKITNFCKVLSEFALEYRTTRDRITTQKEKKQTRDNRDRTRGKLITEVRSMIFHFNFIIDLFFYVIYRLFLRKVVYLNMLYRMIFVLMTKRNSSINDRMIIIKN